MVTERKKRHRQYVGPWLQWTLGWHPEYVHRPIRGAVWGRNDEDLVQAEVFGPLAEYRIGERWCVACRGTGRCTYSPAHECRSCDGLGRGSDA